MPDIHTYKVERLKVIGGLTHKQQRFFIRPGSRSRPWKFFDGWEVPEFDGDHAWFEIERSRGAWIFRGRVERQAPQPSAPASACSGLPFPAPRP